MDEAITSKKQVSFAYANTGVDKKPHPRTDGDGRVRRYVVNPYQMVAANGRYYLICNYDKYDTLANYRIDRISGIELLDRPAKDKRQVRGLEKGLDLPRHLAEHVYMFAGESAAVEFRAKRSTLATSSTASGWTPVFTDVTDDELTVRVRVNPRGDALLGAAVRQIRPRDASGRPRRRAGRRHRRDGKTIFDTISR